MMKFLFLIAFIISSAQSVSFAADSKLQNTAKLLESKAVEKLKVAEAAKLKKAAKRVALPVPSDEEMKAEGFQKEIEGFVAARNNFGFALEYDVDPAAGSSKEIWFNLHTKVKYQGYKDAAAIKVDDVVRVNYKVTKKTKKIFLENIKYVGKKPAELPVPQAADEKATTESAAPLAPEIKS